MITPRPSKKVEVSKTTWKQLKTKRSSLLTTVNDVMYFIFNDHKQRILVDDHQQKTSSISKNYKLNVNYFRESADSEHGLLWGVS